MIILDRGDFMKVILTKIFEQCKFNVSISFWYYIVFAFYLIMYYSDNKAEIAQIIINSLFGSHVMLDFISNIMKAIVFFLWCITFFKYGTVIFTKGHGNNAMKQREYNLKQYYNEYHKSLYISVIALFIYFLDNYYHDISKVIFNAVVPILIIVFLLFTFGIMDYFRNS